MAASKPSSSTSQRHFSSPPAMPTTRPAPLIRATWPATLPTAPAAPLMTTVSPSSSAPTSSTPKYAVRPGMPSAPRYEGSGASDGSIFCIPPPSAVTYSCAPKIPVTWSPSANPSWREASTLPTPPARITSPIPTGSMYERPSFIQPRIAGSSDRYSVLTRTSPSPGSRTGSSVWSQSLGLGSPWGRAARRTWWLVASMVIVSRADARAASDRPLPVRRGPLRDHRAPRRGQLLPLHALPAAHRDRRGGVRARRARLAALAVGRGPHPHLVAARRRLGQGVLHRVRLGAVQPRARRPRGDRHPPRPVRRRPGHPADAPPPRRDRRRLGAAARRRAAAPRRRANIKPP